MQDIVKKQKIITEQLVDTITTIDDTWDTIEDISDIEVADIEDMHTDIENELTDT